MIEDVVIVEMQKRHIEHLAKIEKECFSTPWSEKSLSEELENHVAHFFVAEKNGLVCGYIGMHVILDEAYISNIAVRAQFRGINIGTTLLKHVISFSKNNYLSFISLEVRKSNSKAIKFYKLNGFRAVGTRHNFYNSPQEDAIIMTHNL